MKEKIALLLSTIQTIILIVILVILITGRKHYQDRPGVVSGKLEAHTKVEKPLKITESDAIWGKKNASNTIIAFVDYQCPYCKEVYKSLKEIEKDYINTGKVKVIFRDFPLRMHEHAREFANAVECSRRQGKFWDMTDLILTTKEKPDSLSVFSWSEELGLDKNKFAACMEDSAINLMIKNDMQEAKSYTVRGTPALFINDVLYRGTMPASMLKDILDGKNVGKKPKTGSCNQKP